MGGCQSSSLILPCIVAGDVLEGRYVHATLAEARRCLLQAHGIISDSVLHTHCQVTEDVIFFTPSLITHAFQVCLDLAVPRFATR